MLNVYLTMHKLYELFEQVILQMWWTKMPPTVRQTIYLLCASESRVGYR